MPRVRARRSPPPPPVGARRGASGCPFRGPPAQRIRRPARREVRPVLGALARAPVRVGTSGGAPRKGSGAPGSCGSPSAPPASAAAFPDSRARRLDVTVIQMTQPAHPMSMIAIKTSPASISRPPPDTGRRVQILHAPAARRAAHGVDSHPASQKRGADRPGGARETGLRRKGERLDRTRDADSRAPVGRPGTRWASARVAESSGVGRRASRADRNAAAILAWGRSLSGPRTRTQLSGSARTVRCAASAAWSERGETPLSARVPTALTTKSNGKSRCHITVILAGVPAESQGGSGWSAWQSHDPRKNGHMRDELYAGDG